MKVYKISIILIKIIIQYSPQQIKVSYNKKICSIKRNKIFESAFSEKLSSFYLPYNSQF